MTALVIVAGTLVASPAGAAPPAVPSTGTVVATASSPNGPVLVVGSGAQQGLALYFITSDQPPVFGCTTTVVTIPSVGGYHCAGLPSDQTADWPALITVGRPVAGPGVRPSLLGTVARPDLPGTQVTYAGHPLYLFDPAPGQFTGSDLVQAALPPDHGVWYLVSPKRGVAAPHVATVTATTLQGGRKVLGGVMSATPGGPPAPETFPVYTYSLDRAGLSACQRACAVKFPPLLTSASPHVAPGSGLVPSKVGMIVRADGTRQVTYNGKPLYLDGDEKLDITNPSTPFSGTGEGAKPPVRAAGTFSLVSVP
jgi:predicted lipoprotein with Yx(FWY)xxD motif